MRVRISVRTLHESRKPGDSWAPGMGSLSPTGSRVLKDTGIQVCCGTQEIIQESYFIIPTDGLSVTTQTAVKRHAIVYTNQQARHVRGQRTRFDKVLVKEENQEESDGSMILRMADRRGMVASDSWERDL